MGELAEEVSETGLGLWLEELGLGGWGGVAFAWGQERVGYPTPQHRHTGSLGFSLQATLEVQS